MTNQGKHTGSQKPRVHKRKVRGGVERVRTHKRAGSRGAVARQRAALAGCALFVAAFAFVVVSVAGMPDAAQPVQAAGGQQVHADEAGAQDANEAGNQDASAQAQSSDSAEEEKPVKLEPDGEGWDTGRASAYSLETNDGWDATSSGIPLDEESYTVAVAMQEASLLGREVELFYRGVQLTAKVTDTGALAPLGRKFDLAPAVWEEFGAATEDGWGVRTVFYRFVPVGQD